MSVILPTFNRAGTVLTAVNSAACQNLALAEIIVVDDNSTDDTESVVSTYRGTVQLRYIRLDRNQGGAAARNAGVAAAKGEYVAFLDSDDEWLPEHLHALFVAAKGRSGDFVISSSITKIGSKLQLLPGRPYPISGSLAQKLHFVLSAELAFQTSTLLMPLTTARRFPFDARLRRHQDWDLICRVIEGDVPVILLPEATALYRPPARGGNLSRTHGTQPSLRFLAKHRKAMQKKTVARFIALEIARRRPDKLRKIALIANAALRGGLTIKESIYYLSEALARWRE